ncbi:unnamed protein product, partial [Brenthis ino]
MKIFIVLMILEVIFAGVIHKNRAENMKKEISVPTEVKVRNEANKKEDLFKTKKVIEHSEKKSFNQSALDDKEDIKTKKTKEDFDDTIIVSYSAFVGDKCAIGLAKINGICADIDY